MPAGTTGVLRAEFGEPGTGDGELRTQSSGGTGSAVRSATAEEEYGLAAMPFCRNDDDCSTRGLPFVDRKAVTRDVADRPRAAVQSRR